MKKSLEDYLTESEKNIMKKLEEDYKKTGDVKSYQTAQQLLSIAETRRSVNKLNGRDYNVNRF